VPGKIREEMKVLISEKTKKAVKSKSTASTINAASGTSERGRPVLASGSRFERYEEFLPMIQHENQAYPDWIDTDFALRKVSNTEEMYQIFAEWSQVDYPGYDENATGCLSLRISDDRQNGIAFDTQVFELK
jgi:hypothetical protein